MNVACQHESGRACVTLGHVLNEGRLVPRDPSEAAKDFGAACDPGVRDACLSLVALVQHDGQDVFRRPCDKGDGESCFIPASLYYGGAGRSQRRCARPLCFAKLARADGGAVAAGWRNAIGRGLRLAVFPLLLCIAACGRKRSPGSGSGRLATSAHGKRARLILDRERWRSSARLARSARWLIRDVRRGRRNTGRNACATTIP